ncbi:MAG: hypothetical protein LC687_04920 [Actinobacteria bacterium]|nr:hypothetical protein [Actinomycetota bacterium]
MNSKLNEMMDTGIPWEWLDTPEWGEWKDFITGPKEGKFTADWTATPAEPIEIPEPKTLLQTLEPFMPTDGSQDSWDFSSKVYKAALKAGSPNVYITLDNGSQLAYHEWDSPSSEKAVNEVLNYTLSHASFMVYFDSTVFKEDMGETGGGMETGSVTHLWFETHLYTRRPNGELQMIMTSVEQIDAGGIIMKIMPTVVDITLDTINYVNQLTPGHPHVFMFSGKGGSRQRLYDAMGRRLSKGTPYNYVGSKDWFDLQDSFPTEGLRFQIGRAAGDYVEGVRTKSLNYYLVHNSIELEG